MSSIYVSTVCLPGKEPLDARVERYAAAGLSAVEFGAGVTVDGELPQGNYLIHNYFPPPAESFVLNLASKDDTVRQRSIDMARNGLALCARMGAPFYSVHAGFITDPTGFGTTSFIFPSPQSSEEAEAAWEIFLASVELLTEDADRLGVDLLIENNVCPLDLKGKLLLQTPQEFLVLFERIRSPRLGILLDTGHLRVSATTYGFDPTAGVTALAAHIRAFHLHDNDGLSDLHLPAERKSWAVMAIQSEAFQDLPVVVEARHESADALARYVVDLQRWRREAHP
ncbi:MAG: sugar phosphate isomerase/epimerase [Actinomycetia bacterium]|nr:sugar phosphate isomerase/epimerase [Actinomycetes bacterium]